MGSRDHWVCRITDLSREFRGLSFWEVWRKQKQIKVQTAKDTLQADKLRKNHEERVDAIISSAIKQTPKSEATKAERLKGVSHARSEQLEIEREQRRLDKKQLGETATVVHLTPPEDSDDYPDFEDELFDDGDD